MLAGGCTYGGSEALSLQIWSAKYVNRIYASCARQLVDQAKNRQNRPCSTDSCASYLLLCYSSCLSKYVPINME